MIIVDETTLKVQVSYDEDKGLKHGGLHGVCAADRVTVFTARGLQANWRWLLLV